MAAPIVSECPGCGAAITDRFCSHCGERRPGDQQYSLRALAEEALEHVAQFDGTLVRTLRALFLSPGTLTAAYMRGDRVRYTRPLQLFLLANVAFFVISGALHVRALDTPLQQHLRVMPYRALAATMVDQRLAERHVTAAEYGRTFAPPC